MPNKLSMSRAGPGSFTLEVDGIPHSFRFPPAGNLEQIVLKVLSGREYAPLKLPGWSPRTILDVGANVGASAVFFSLAYPNARIHAFEPSPSTFAFLADNTAWLPNVTGEARGLFDRDTRLRLYQGRAQCAQASLSLSVETRDDAFEEIELVRASKALADKLAGPVILKVDTEGSEVAILRDLDEHIDSVELLFLEYHSESDRRTLDRMLDASHVLWRAHATSIHRGTLAYLHRRMLERWPALGEMEIRPPS